METIQADNDEEETILDALAAFYNYLNTTGNIQQHDAGPRPAGGGLGGPGGNARHPTPEERRAAYAATGGGSPLADPRRSTSQEAIKNYLQERKNK